MPRLYPMTVVMATLGGDTLSGTIEQLNRGTIYPAEILVCIPEKEALRAAHLSFTNVKVIVTACRGQVAQRAIGFQKAAHDIVMQLDDDIRVDEHCIARLLQTLQTHSPLVAVAPALREDGAGDMTRMKNPLFLKMFYFLCNGREGFRMGGVSRAGHNFGYDRSPVKEGVHDVEWFPGGCVIHFRQNLITENFFPFEGKAYGEDVLHCYYLAKNGIRLKVDLDAHCYLENASTASYGIREFIRMISGHYRSKKYYVKLSSRSLIRMNLFYAALVLNYFIKKLNCLSASVKLNVLLRSGHVT